ncbi:MAG: rod shape-determining protein RodA [Myxococcales bacterium]|nr:rod shape-determining protein RodA [Myxococcales bacterium]MBK7197323.1 rod shape-determining protein RodA [Myxococcales bacterium]
MRGGVGISLPRAQIGMTRWRRFRAAVDWPLVATIVVIAALGLLNLYSAVNGTRHAGKFDQQLRWMFVGAIAFAAFTAIDYRSLLRVAWIGFGLALVALIIVDVAGSNAKGSERWISIGTLGGQPSELAKLAVILVLARLVSDGAGAKPSWATLAPKLLLLCVPVVLIAVQPDLGTATLLTLIMLSVGFLALRDLWPMVYTLFGMFLAVPILWESMHRYQKDRVLAFLDPSADSTGSGWHTLQSIFAVGSGKLLGKGFMSGTQNQFDFLPEHWTDFPFSVWAEEWGFVGAVVMLALFAFLIVWLLNIALRARDAAGAVLCVGVAAMTFWHVIVNVAMVLGMAPVVGVTLPFISYGGSSLLTFFIGMGLCGSVSLRRHGY